MRTVFRAEDPDVNAYRLLTALVVPRPIAWISSLDTHGVATPAPPSFFNGACATPPIVSFASVGGKDTLANVEATGEFVVNLASEPLMRQVNDTSARFGPDVDEAQALGIALEPSDLVAPPRAVDSPASLECVLHSTHELGASTLVLGRVVAITVQAEVLVDGHPAVERLRPVSRLGRDEWGLPPDVVSVRRPDRPGD